MRVLLLGMLLTTGTLAGCLSGTPDAPAEDTEDVPTASPTKPIYVHGNAVVRSDDALEFSRTLSSEWLPVGGYDAREPTVAVTSDGTLYYAARDYSGGQTPPVSATQTPIMRSRDQGHTWEDVSPLLPTGDREPPRSGDPMVIVDPWTDRIFQIELYDLVCNWLVYSDDGGDSWTGNPKACSSLVVDHQTIGAGPPALATTQTVGYPNVVYVCVNQIADSHCSRSLTGGLTFESFHLVYPGADPVSGDVCGGIHGHVLVAPDGAVYLPREYCGRAYVAVSRDDGLTWDLMDVGGGLGSATMDPNMAFDADGTVYYAFTSEDPEAVYVSWTNDAGATWSEPVQASPPHLTAANHPSITAGSDGRIGLVFLGTTATDLEDDWENATWDAYMGVSLDATSATPTFTTLRVSPPGDHVFRGNCMSIRCGYVREFLDASVAPDGSFWGAFVDACLTDEEARYDYGDLDCNRDASDYGEGNGHLGFVGRLVGANLWEGNPGMPAAG